MASEYLERMGERMRARREELGLSRSDVARRMPGKTNENAIYRWEGGKHRPHDDALEALAQVLDVPITYFLADEPDKTSTPDLVGTLNGDGPSQTDRLDRLEELLQANHELLIALAVDRGIIELPGAADARRAIQAWLKRRREAS